MVFNILFKYSKTIIPNLLCKSLKKNGWRKRPLLMIHLYKVKTSPGEIFDVVIIVGKIIIIIFFFIFRLHPTIIIITTIITILRRGPMMYDNVFITDGRYLHRRPRAPACLPIYKFIDIVRGVNGFLKDRAVIGLRGQTRHIVNSRRIIL